MTTTMGNLGQNTRLEQTGSKNFSLVSRNDYYSDFTRVEMNHWQMN